MKRLKKEQAIILRKQGHSLSEISQQLNIAKSSASQWVRNVALSRQAKLAIAKKRDMGRRAAQHARKSRTQHLLYGAEQKADEVVHHSTGNHEFEKILCGMIYWCEGAKSKNDGSFTFTNSDPDLIRAFLHLLRKSFPLDERKFRVSIHLHNYHNSDTQLRFWSQVTNIPLAQFMRPYRKSNTGKRRKPDYAGCASVRYHDVTLAREIQAIARAAMRKYKGSIV